jgi:hypothetical protein
LRKRQTRTVPQGWHQGGTWIDRRAEGVAWLAPDRSCEIRVMCSKAALMSPQDVNRCSKLIMAAGIGTGVRP